MLLPPGTVTRGSFTVSVRRLAARTSDAATTRQTSSNERPRTRDTSLLHTVPSAWRHQWRRPLDSGIRPFVPARSRIAALVAILALLLAVPFERGRGCGVC